MVEIRSYTGRSLSVLANFNAAIRESTLPIATIIKRSIFGKKIFDLEESGPNSDFFGNQLNPVLDGLTYYRGWLILRASGVGMAIYYPWSFTGEEADTETHYGTSIQVRIIGRPYHRWIEDCLNDWMVAVEKHLPFFQRHPNPI